MPALTLDAVPRLALSAERIASLNLDHRAGFLLSQIDGATSVETLLDLACVISRVDALRIVAGFVASGVVELH